MSTTNNGGPAFPGLWVNESDINATSPTGHVVPPGAAVQMNGMTLRDYFAAKALPTVLDWESTTTPEHAAELAYGIADAMLKARQA